MLAIGALIAQLRPADTSIATAFTATMPTEISLIIIHNSDSSSRGFSLYHDDDGTTFDLTTALYVAEPVTANRTLRLESQAVGAGIQVAIGGSIGVSSALADALTISIYGTSTKRIGYV